MSLDYNEKNITLARNLRKNATPQENHLWYDFLSDQHKLSWCLRVYRCRRKSLPPRGRGTALAVEGDFG